MHTPWSELTASKRRGNNEKGSNDFYQASIWPRLSYMGHIHYSTAVCSLHNSDLTTTRISSETGIKLKPFWQRGLAHEFLNIASREHAEQQTSIPEGGSFDSLFI
jgi:hypothetical protein